MKAVILAGGLGSRLAEETSIKPKPMVEIGERPILWHIMKIYSHYGVNEFVICLGYKGHVIKDYFLNYASSMSDITVDTTSQEVTLKKQRSENWRIHLVETGKDSMTGGRIKAIADYLDDEPFHMTYGDGVADIDISALEKFHIQHGGLATVTAVTPPGRFGVLDIQDGHVTGFREKIASDQYKINAGFFVLDPKVIGYIDNAASIWEQEPMRNLISDNQLLAYNHAGFWQAMDTIRDRQKLEEMLDCGDAPWVTW